jgi:hypothetical protein
MQSQLDSYHHDRIVFFVASVEHVQKERKEKRTGYYSSSHPFYKASGETSRSSASVAGTDTCSRPSSSSLVQPSMNPLPTA